MQSFKDIIAWEKSHELVLEVYRLTDSFPKSELLGLVSQSRRCVVSIPSNIAEGFKRKSKVESVRFYNIAESSLEELKYQILLARDLDYINKPDYENFIQSADEVGKLLYGWIKSQKQ